MKKEEEKESLHTRNKHRSRYDFKSLVSCCPELSTFVFTNQYNNQTIDFANPDAVKTLNKALLKFFYNISNWDIPKNYLCPPIPGRADYIHYIADVLSASNNNSIPKGKSIRILDIGTGANCVYPIIGNHEYGWSFVGSDIDDSAILSAKKILASNIHLKDIEIRKQNNSTSIFKGIIQSDELFDFTICNPPFHSSLEDAMEGTTRKVRNLSSGKVKKTVLNFGGQPAELWCKGGEKEFATRMIKESAELSANCFWFSSLISKSENLNSIYDELGKVKATEIKTIEMKQGNKISRFVAWSFLTPAEQKEWQEKRFKDK